MFHRPGDIRDGGAEGPALGLPTGRLLHLHQQYLPPDGPLFSQLRLQETTQNDARQTVVQAENQGQEEDSEYIGTKGKLQDNG